MATLQEDHTRCVQPAGQSIAVGCEQGHVGQFPTGPDQDGCVTTLRSFSHGNGLQDGPGCPRYLNSYYKKS